MKTATRNAAPGVLTPWQEAKRERDARMASEHAALLRERPDRSRTVMKDYLKEKYGLVSDSAYYAALERGAHHLEEKGGASWR